MENHKELFELFKDIDIKKQTLDDWEPTASDSYENVNLNNYIEILEIACKQYEFLMANRNLSGLYFVDWRVNFSNLEIFIKQLNPAMDNELMARFIQYYDDKSANELYKRIGV